MKPLSYLFTMLLLSSACQGNWFSQQIDYVPDTAMLANAYETYREPTITNRRFKHADIEPLILKRKGGDVFEVSQLGVSVLKKPIYQLRYGSGPKKVMMWSQMHGNEPTATMALMDLFNFLEAEGDGLDSIRSLLRERTSLYFIPMLNPDGADVYTRRNAMDIDINRDARAGETAEGKLLISAAKTVQPDYGFNLHDMHIYYNVPGTSNPVTVALLAPAYNQQREINDVRGDAMRIAAGINRILQGYVPNGVAKYDDTYSPRAFGDNFQTWGARTVLIESGGYPGDPEKQFIRKLNFIVLLNALIEIAQGSYTQYEVAEYEAMPFSESKLSDLVLRNVGVSRDSLHYKVDLSIVRNEVTETGDYRTFYVQGRISDVGDLKEQLGYAELDATGYHFMPGKVYPTAFSTIDQLTRDRAIELLREGYAAVRVTNQPKNRLHTLPIGVFNTRAPSISGPNLGSAANFFIAKDNVPVYAVINGYLIDLAETPDETFKNYVW